MDVQQDVARILAEVLYLKSTERETLTRDSRLLGSMPFLDSMAVLAIITRLEEHFGFTVLDDDLDASTFATVGTLTDFIVEKLSQVRR